LQQIVQAHSNEKEAFSFNQSNAWPQRFETLSETFSGTFQGL
jgi:hypothetical protein